MALDLLFGRTKRNWSRGCAPHSAQRLALSDEVDFRLTETEMKTVVEIVTLKAKADAGDPEARLKMKVLAKRMVALRSRAKKGDRAAKRALDVLRETGVFNESQTITMGSELVAHDTYRVAVLNQARKLAQRSNRRRPATKDFYQAKKAVDNVMSQAGISLYLPGARRGRLTA